jgi:hypothetical protein
MESTKPNGHTRIDPKHLGARETHSIDSTSRRAPQQAGARSSKLETQPQKLSVLGNSDAEIDELVAQCDVEQAIQFLKWLDEDGWHNLVAIHPDKNAPNRVSGRTFAPRDWDGMRKFIKIHNGKRNLYFSVKPPGLQDDPGRFRNTAFFDKMYGDCSGRGNS